MSKCLGKGVATVIFPVFVLGKIVVWNKNAKTLTSIQDFCIQAKASSHGFLIFFNKSSKNFNGTQPKSSEKW